MRHFVAESVVAVIENKARIDSTEKLEEAVDNIASAKRLDRVNHETNTCPWILSADEASPFARSIFAAIATEKSVSAYVDVGQEEKFWA